MKKELHISYSKKKLVDNQVSVDMRARRTESCGVALLRD